MSAADVRLQTQLDRDGTPLVMTAERLRLEYAAGGGDAIEAHRVPGQRQAVGSVPGVDPVALFRIQV